MAWKKNQKCGGQYNIFVECKGGGGPGCGLGYANTFTICFVACSSFIFIAITIITFFTFWKKYKYKIPKLWNQVPSLDHFVVQNSGDFLCWKYKQVVCFYVTKIETIVSYWEEYCESVQSRLLEQVWNIKTHNLFIFSTEKIPRILNHKEDQGADLIT